MSAISRSGMASSSGRKRTGNWFQASHSGCNDCYAQSIASPGTAATMPAAHRSPLPHRKVYSSKSSKQSVWVGVRVQCWAPAPHMPQLPEQAPPWLPATPFLQP